MTDKYAAWKSPVPQKTHWFAWLQKRNVHLIALILLFAAAIALALFQYRNAQQSLELAASAPVNALAEQYGLLLGDAVMTRQQEEINSHLIRLVKSPLIHRAAVFDLEGNLLGSAGVKSSIPEAQDPANLPSSVRMMAITAHQQAETAVLQLTVNDSALLNARRELTRSAFSLHAGLLIFGVVTGAVLTLLSWRYRFLLLNKTR